MSNSRIKGVRYRRAPLKQRVIDHVRWFEKCDCDVRVVGDADSVTVTHEKRCWSHVVKRLAQ